jgi:hypothetical protein
MSPFKATYTRDREISEGTRNDGNHSPGDGPGSLIE